MRMVTGWRRAFCTSIPKDRESKVLTEKKHCDNNITNQSPKISNKFAFFSNPSTPRPHSQPVASSSLRCRTTVAAAATSSVPNSPKLQCGNAKTPKKQNSPSLLHLSNPSSPKSPSSFALLRASLRLSRSRCGICAQSVKTGQGTAIFTAECSHTFHFPCIAAHVKKQHVHICPVCNANWKELPVLAICNNNNKKQQNKDDEVAEQNNRAYNLARDIKTRPLKIYNDDEPLMSPTSVARFNPIPESDENEEDLEEESTEFQGFNVSPAGPLLSSSPRIRTIELSLLPEAAIVAANRSYETYVVVLKVKAPPLKSVARRNPIDLVTVLDVGGSMAGEKLKMMKRSMRVVISSLGSTDRLSIIAFSSGSKRILPLRRMTSNGQRSARRIVDALTIIDQNREEIKISVTDDALKKASKVIEDRREKNPFTSIILFSNHHTERSITTTSTSSNQISSSRFSHLEIPIHAVRFADGGACTHAPEDLLGKRVGGFLSVVAQDLKLQLGIVSRSGPVEVAAVYSMSGRPTFLGSGQIRLGDLYAEEERELLVELKVPAASAGSHHVLSVRSSYRDPSTEEVVSSKDNTLVIPRPHAVRSSDRKIERLRNLHVSARGVAESRRLAEHGDVSGAYYLLTSARALLMQSRVKSATDEFLSWLEAEQAELQQRGLGQKPSRCRRATAAAWVEEKAAEPNTPTSAWRAAERLAKVAIMRKSLNRVSDLHGFENARF